MAVAAFALGTGITAHAQSPDFTYRGYVTVDPGPPSLAELIWAKQQIEQRNATAFQRMWLYQLSYSQRLFWVYAVPGVGAAIKNNDWAAAWSYVDAWAAQELFYEKHYHQRSPAWVAANNAACAKPKRTK